MKPDAPLLATLALNPWFASLRATEQRALVQMSHWHSLRPGEMLFRQGDRGDAHAAFYGLLRGTLKFSSLRADGKEAIVAVLEAGHWFGEASLIDGLARTHDGTAVGACEVLVLPGADFQRLMAAAPFARAISALLAARVRSLYGLVEDAALRSTRARVARRLLLLGHGDAAHGPQARHRVRVSQEALAMMLGISRQTLSKELQALRAQGVIRLGYGQIEIASAAQLEALGADT